MTVLQSPIPSPFSDTSAARTTTSDISDDLATAIAADAPESGAAAYALDIEGILQLDALIASGSGDVAARLSEQPWSSDRLQHHREQARQEPEQHAQTHPEVQQRPVQAPPQPVVQRSLGRASKLRAKAHKLTSAGEPDIKLQRYQDAVEQEQELRAQVNVLAEQLARYAPLEAPAPLQIRLRRERARLGQLRAGIARLRDEQESSEVLRVDALELDAHKQESLSELDTKLQRYQDAVEQEQELHAQVNLLAEQLARYGPLEAPVRLQLRLRRERARLEQLRAEIARLEQELGQAEQEYGEAISLHSPELNVHKQRVERLQSDLTSQREQLRWHEANIRALEALQAKYLLDTPVGVMQGLRALKQERAALRAQLAADERELRDVYGLRVGGEETASSVRPAAAPADFTMRLQLYRDRRHEERELRDQVYILARQAAQYGELSPVWLQNELASQRAKLEQLRAEIAGLEQDLQREQGLYEAERAGTADAQQLDIHEQRIEQLQSDLASKREQADIHEASIRYLQTIDARYRPLTPLHILHEIDATIRRMTILRQEIGEEEQVLVQAYGVPLDLLQGGRYNRDIEALEAHGALQLGVTVSPELNTKIRHYRHAVEQEQELRAQVNLLAEQLAKYGPLEAPARLQIQLRRERARLEQLRAEIARLEQELGQAEQDYDEAIKANAPELDVHKQRVERLQSDLTSQREQLRWHEVNIRALEALQAKYLLDTPVGVMQGLRALKQERAALRAQLAADERELRDVYGLRVGGEAASSARATVASGVRPAVVPADFTMRVQVYNDRRHEERQLREQVYILARQAAQYGELSPLWLQNELASQRAKLEQLRAEIAGLEQDLEREQARYEAERAGTADAQQLDIHEQRIEQLQSDLASKREQADIHEASIRYLQTIEARYRPLTPPHILHEIDATIRRMTLLRQEIGEEEQVLVQAYGVPLDLLQAGGVTTYHLAGDDPGTSQVEGRM